MRVINIAKRLPFFLFLILLSCAPETKYKVLSFFFDGVPKPGSEKTSPETNAREEKIQKIPLRKENPKNPELVPEKPIVAQVLTPPKKSLAAEASTRWEKVEPGLPKDANGGIRWLKAMRDGLIQPQAGLTSDVPPLEPFQLDLELVPEGMPDFRVIFSHESHTGLLSCEGCHSEIFEMEKGNAAISMDAIYAGRYCGVCHGPVAFEIDTNCERCHVGMADEEAETTQIGAIKGHALGNLVFKRKKAMPGIPLAQFPHWVHRIRYTCNVCHSELFKQKQGETQISMAMMQEGKSCAVCHDGVLAWKIGFETCSRCHFEPSSGS